MEKESRKEAIQRFVSAWYRLTGEDFSVQFGLADNKNKEKKNSPAVTGSGEKTSKRREEASNE